jgi:hypothetical protein
VLALLKQLWEARNPGQPYTLLRLHKFPLAQGSKGEHNNLKWNNLLEVLPRELITPSAPAAATEEIFHDLSDGQLFKDPIPGHTLARVLHTHTPTPSHSTFPKTAPYTLQTPSWDTAQLYSRTLRHTSPASTACFTSGLPPPHQQTLRQKKAQTMVWTWSTSPCIPHTPVS